MFAHRHWALLALICLLIAACSGNSSDSKPGSSPTPPTQPKKPSNALQQIPAAEILGSTVQRNLRYQPETETDQIVRLDTLLEYIRRVGLSLRREIGKLQPELPTAGTAVVGLKSTGETKLWYVFPEGLPSPAFKSAAEAAIAAVPKIHLKKSLVVFGVALTLWGYKESEREAAVVELPKEWRAITERSKDPLPATKLAEMTWYPPVE